MDKKNILALITISSLIFYIVFIILAIGFYAGGTETNPFQLEYAFWENSLSDLGMSQNYRGISNTASMVLFTIGTTVFGLSFISFNIGFPLLFKEQRPTRILTLFACILGFFVAIGMVGIAFTPSNLLPTYHMIFVYMAYASLFFSTVLYTIAIFVNKNIHRIYGIITAGFAVIFFATLMMGLVGLGGTANIMEIGQKIGRGLTIIIYLILSLLIMKK